MSKLGVFFVLGLLLVVAPISAWVLSSEEEMQAFRDFLAEREIKFVLVPSG